MTEEEAKTKWCPFVRGVFGKNQNDSFDLKSNTVHNRVLLDTGDVGIHPAINCIGSACMAWRWALSPDKAAHFNKTWKTKGEPEANPVGYCGLAGKP